jgi:hypothetical protein
VYGRPDLTGSGDLTAGSPVVLNLTDAAPRSLAGLFLSASSTPVSFKGGTLYTFPFGALLFLTTDDAGQIWAPLAWPAGIPSQTSVWFQYAIQDATAMGGVSVSNAVKATTP